MSFDAAVALGVFVMQANVRALHTRALFQNLDYGVTGAPFVECQHRASS
jgi:hypothetical protein